MKELSDFLELEDLPNEIQEHAKELGIASIDQFSIKHLYDLYGYGYPYYIPALTRMNKFMVRIIKKHYKDATPKELSKIFRIPHQSAVTYYKKVHHTANSGNKDMSMFVEETNKIITNKE